MATFISNDNIGISDTLLRSFAMMRFFGETIGISSDYHTHWLNYRPMEEEIVALSSAYHTHWINYRPMEAEMIIITTFYARKWIKHVEETLDIVNLHVKYKTISTIVKNFISHVIRKFYIKGKIDEDIN